MLESIDNHHGPSTEEAQGSGPPMQEGEFLRSAPCDQTANRITVRANLLHGQAVASQHSGGAALAFLGHAPTSSSDPLTKPLLLGHDLRFPWLPHRLRVPTRQARGQWFNPTTPHH